MKKTRTTPFDPARWTPDMQVEYQDGTPVRVLCVDGPIPDFPIVGIFHHETSTYTDCARADQLRFVEPVTTVWISYYGDSCNAYEYASKNEADEDIYASRLACFEVEKTWQP